MSLSAFSPLLPDPLLGLSEQFRADHRPGRMDLGVGVYRDEFGQTPVFAAVKAAERLLLEQQDSKAYLGSEGDRAFVDLLGNAALGSDLRLRGLQTVGGTGALRIAADVLGRCGTPRRLWLGTPSWPNHAPIFSAAGLRVETYPLWDSACSRFRPEAVLDVLDRALPGDVVLVQPSCHNPTGVDPDPALAAIIAREVAQRGLILMLDMAYQGIGAGWDADAAAARAMIAGVPEVLVAYSCDKNFGLYRDRVGALYAKAESALATEILWGHFVAAARASYSMPPDHGAAVVRSILSDPALEQEWRAELDAMRRRIDGLRARLAGQGQVGVIDLAPIATGRGMFAMLPVSATQVETLRQRHGIYMAQSGRLNIAGLAEANVAAFAEALHAIQLEDAA